MNSPRYELRVGAFVLVSLVLLAIFVLFLSDFTSPFAFRLHADFAYVGGLQSGAPVKISGVKIGKVVDMNLLHEEDMPKISSGSPALGQRVPPCVRVTLALDKDAVPLVREGTLVMAAMQGVIGESYIELSPGAKNAPALPSGAALRAVDAPHLYVMMLQAESLLQLLAPLPGEKDVGMPNDRSEAAAQVANLFRTVNEIVGERREDLRTALGDAVATAADLRVLMRDLREAAQKAELPELAANSKVLIENLKNEVPRSIALLQANLKNLEQVLGKADKAVDPVAVAALIAELRVSAKKMSELGGQAQLMLAAVQKGEGSIGGFYKNPQVYNDVSELLHDLKSHPWKMLWRD